MENVLRVVQPAKEMALDRPRETASWFDALFREHYPRITAMLARLTGDRGQSEEIASDVFCKLSRQGPVDGQTNDLAAWIYRVATNAGLDALRNNARRRQREREAGIESLRVGGSATALDGLLRAERCGRVRTVLESLKPREAQLLLLRAQGLAYKEVAGALGIQAASVGTLLARAEAEFERKYRARYGENV